MVPGFVDGDEENKEEESSQNVTNATICDDLEQLLETGYAELIRTGFGDDAEDGKEAKMAVVLDESPFPKGMTVFDDDADGDENSPFEDEFESGYEVICQREIVQIPNYPGADSNGGAASQTMIG